jgi:hypothetical protein
VTNADYLWLSAKVDLEGQIGWAALAFLHVDLPKINNPDSLPYGAGSIFLKKKRKRKRKVKKMKASWDFELDNIINIPAMQGVDPKNLTDEQWKQCHELLLEKLKVLIQEDDITFSFEKVFDRESV